MEPGHPFYRQTTKMPGSLFIPIRFLRNPYCTLLKPILKVSALALPSPSDKKSTANLLAHAVKIIHECGSSMISPRALCTVFMATVTLCYNLGMNRRQLGFIVLVNAVLSLAVALGVVWAIDARRPDPEELAALYTPIVQATVAQAIEPVVASVVTTASLVPALQDTQATVTSTPTLAEGEQQIYVVTAGDSLFAIAERFHVSADQIMAANQLKDPNVVFSGQRLKIPTKATIIPDTVTPIAQPVPTEAATSLAPTAIVTTVENTATPAAPIGLQIETVDAPGNLLSEAILLVNNGGQPYNLQGWRLERQDGPAYTFGNVQLFQGSSIWLHSGDGADTSIALYWKQGNPVWQSGAVARLINTQGEQAASYTIP